MKQLELFPPESPKSRRAKKNVRASSYRIMVTPKLRKEPDIDKLVDAVLRMLKNMTPEELRRLDEERKKKGRRT